MKQQVSVRACMADIRDVHSAKHLFTLIEQCKHAIMAAGCKCTGFSYSDEPDKCHNPRGDIATLTFDILTFDDDPRELKRNDYLFDDYGTKRVYSEAILARKPKEVR